MYPPRRPNSPLFRMLLLLVVGDHCCWKVCCCSGSTFTFYVTPVYVVTSSRLDVWALRLTALQQLYTVRVRAPLQRQKAKTDANRKANANAEANAAITTTANAVTSSISCTAAATNYRFCYCRRRRRQRRCCCLLLLLSVATLANNCTFLSVFVCVRVYCCCCCQELKFKLEKCVGFLVFHSSRRAVKIRENTENADSLLRINPKKRQQIKKGKVKAKKENKPREKCKEKSLLNI